MTQSQDLLGAIDDFLSGLTGSNKAAVDATVAAAGHGHAAGRISKRTGRQIRALLEDIAGGRLDPKILEGLRSTRLSDRIVATRALYGLVADRITRSGTFDPDLLKALIRDIGPEVLIITPGFADAFRRFLTGKGSRSEGRVDDFIDSLTDADDAFMRSALRAAAESRLARRLFGAQSGTFRAAEHFFRASPPAVEAAMTALDTVRRGIGNDDIFFDILFAKVRRLVPKADEAALRSSITAFLSGGKLPDKLSPAGKAKAFDTAAHGGLHGMIGELLMLPKQLKRAEKHARDLGQPVVLMLGVRVKAPRTVVPARDRDKLDKLAEVLDDPEWQELVPDLEKAAEARALASTRAEYSDGLIGRFDGKGRTRLIERHEGKVDAEGVTAGRTEFERNREDIEYIEELRVSQMVEVSPDGDIRYLSPAEAQKLSGGTIEKGEIVLREDKTVLDTLAETQDTAATSAADARRNAEAASKRKITGAANAKKTLFVGKEQHRKFRDRGDDAGDVEVDHYDHDYLTLVDTAVWMLAELGFKTRG